MDYRELKREISKQVKKPNNLWVYIVNIDFNNKEGINKKGKAYTYNEYIITYLNRDGDTKTKKVLSFNKKEMLVLEDLEQYKACKILLAENERGYKDWVDYTIDELNPDEADDYYALAMMVGE